LTAVAAIEQAVKDGSDGVRELDGCAATLLGFDGWVVGLALGATSSPATTATVAGTRELLLKR